MKVTLHFWLLAKLLVFCHATFFPFWLPRVHARLPSIRLPLKVFPPRLRDMPTDWNHQRSRNVAANRDADPPQSGDVCECVLIDQCDTTTGKIITDGTNSVDFRLKSVQCHDDEVCCSLPNDSEEDLGHTLPPTQPSFGSTDNLFSPETCGLRSLNSRLKLNVKVSGDIDETETAEGEHPWTLALISMEPTSQAPLPVLQCGASLVHPRIALTAAHCVDRKIPEQLHLHAGEFALDSSDEVNPVQVRAVKRIDLHPKYKRSPIKYDVALLLVDQPFEKNDGVNIICLPTAKDAAEKNWKDCTAVGWGAQGENGEVGGRLKKATVSMVPFDTCQNVLRTTSLGKLYLLHKSFLCAGGENDIDTCKGDGGGPFTCADELERNYQVGITSWGVGCGRPGLPGVYTDVGKMSEWIFSTIQELLSS